MSGLFSQARTFTLGSLHDLLDKAIDMNSPTMVRQQVRDLESALNEIGTNRVAAQGDLRTMTRQKVEMDAKIATDKATIAQLLKSTDANAQTIATAKATLVLTEQKQSATLADQIVGQQKTIDSISTLEQKLQLQHDQMVLQVHELERLDRDSKSKEHAASAVKNFAALGNSVDSASIDNMRNKMLARNDKASAALDDAMASVNTPDSSANNEDVQALLASLK